MEDEVMDLDPEDEQMDTQDNENSTQQDPSEKADNSLKQKMPLNSLPKTKEELTSLISHIQETVSGNILPKLQRCLDAKVGILGFKFKPKGLKT